MIVLGGQCDYFWGGKWSLVSAKLRRWQTLHPESWSIRMAQCPNHIVVWVNPHGAMPQLHRSLGQSAWRALKGQHIVAQGKRNVVERHPGLNVVVGNAP